MWDIAVDIYRHADADPDVAFGNYRTYKQNFVEDYHYTLIAIITKFIVDSLFCFLFFSV